MVSIALDETHSGISWLNVLLQVFHLKGMLTLYKQHFRLISLAFRRTWPSRPSICQWLVHIVSTSKGICIKGQLTLYFVKHPLVRISLKKCDTAITFLKGAIGKKSLYSEWPHTLSLSSHKNCRWLHSYSSFAPTKCVHYIYVHVLKEWSQRKETFQANDTM